MKLVARLWRCDVSPCPFELCQGFKMALQQWKVKDLQSEWGTKVNRKKNREIARDVVILRLDLGWRVK